MRRRMRKLSGWTWPKLWVALYLALAGCSSEELDTPQETASDTQAALAYGDWGDPFANNPGSPEQLKSVCARAGNDIVRDVFCSSEPAAIGSLLDLEDAL